MAATKPKPKPHSRRSTPAATRRAATSSGPQTPVLEWIAAGVGAVLILVVLSIIVLDMARMRDAPPDFIVRSIGSQRVGQGHVLQIRIENRGERPAAQVEVEGRLDHAAGVETASVTFDDVPGGSSRTGGLLFKSNPQDGAIELSAKSFTDP